MLIPYRFLVFPKSAISRKHYVTVQPRPSCFVRKFLSSFRKLAFTEPITAARSNTRRNPYFPDIFQLCAHEKRPRRIASSRSFTMRFRLAVFAKIAMDGCASGQSDYSHSRFGFEIMVLCVLIWSQNAMILFFFSRVILVC